MKIITISREFGSGGRELGKRLSDRLNVPYYDREIITAVAKKYALDENYVDTALESGKFRTISLTFGRTFYCVPAMPYDTQKLMVEQQKVIKALAQRGDCIIIGRNADILLEEYDPLKIFVYADMDSRIKRCMERMQPEEQLNRQELEKKIRQIDKKRLQHHAMISETAWGSKEAYDLCVNTTGVAIKSIVPSIADFSEEWFSQRKKAEHDGSLSE